jgi:hypothetical protein
MELRAPTPGEQRETLANRLVPVVDRIRHLSAIFGVRPYRVFLVHSTWTGGEIGVGRENVASIEIVPPPRVRELGSLTEVLRATGTTEEGDIEVDRISARYTEDDLLGRTPDLRDPNAPRTTVEGAEFFWEIVETRPSTPYPVVRRFAVRGLPELRRGAAEWTVRLVKQDYDRGRRGGTDRDSF